MLQFDGEGFTVCISKALQFVYTYVSLIIVVYMHVIARKATLHMTLSSKVISKAAEWLSAEYSRAPAPLHIYIISGNDSALCHIANTQSHDNQTKLLLWHKSLTAFYSSHRYQDTSISLVWSPVCRSRTQDTGARRAALQACTHAPLSTLNRVQSASYVKQKARQHAYHQWSTQWRLDCGKSLFCDSPTYDYAITQPPAGRN